MNVNQDDPSISEIEDIEKTGEFKEEDYFNEDEVLKESGVEADLEGVEGLEEGEDLEANEEGVIADSEVEDFEGEGFDEEDDFETDVSEAGEAEASEFDESDEFVTEGAVAKNEDLIEGEEVPLADSEESIKYEEENFFTEEEGEEAEEFADEEGSEDEEDDIGEFADEEGFEGEEDDIEEFSDEEGFEGEEDDIGEFADDDEGLKEEEDTELGEMDEEEFLAEDSDEDFEEEDFLAEAEDFDEDFEEDVNDDEDAKGISEKDFLTEVDLDSEEESLSEDNFVEETKPQISDSGSFNEEGAEEEVFEEIAVQQASSDSPSRGEMIDRIVEKVRSWVPVKKMANVPFKRNDILLNTLYVVRPNDNFQTITEKIYGPGSSANLTVLNPYVDPNRMNVGEKVYYNSPNRPNDKAKMLFYYDDIRRQSQTWLVQSGEDIRAVSQKLLGHPRSWMEIWATHSEIVSKGKFESSHTIRYFPDDLESSPSLASNESYEVTENPPEMINDGMVENSMNPIPSPKDSSVASLSDLPDQMEETPPSQSQESVFEDEFRDMSQDSGEKAQLDPTGLSGESTDFKDPNNQELKDPVVNSAAIKETPEKIKQQGQLAQIKNDLMGLDQKTVETLTLGGGGVLLLLMLFYVARKRRKSDVQEMDFTQINEPTKTRVSM